MNLEFRNSWTISETFNCTLLSIEYRHQHLLICFEIYSEEVYGNVYRTFEIHVAMVGIDWTAHVFRESWTIFSKYRQN